MSAKLDKIAADREKARKKRDEWDAKFKDLDCRYKAQENIEIHDLVHAANMTPDELAELLSGRKSMTASSASDKTSLFTYDKAMILVLYGKETRRQTMQALKEILTQLTSEEKELRTMTESALGKLAGISDEDFLQLDMIPDAFS